MQKFLELREVHFQEVEHVKLLVALFKKLIGHVPTTTFLSRVQGLKQMQTAQTTRDVNVWGVASIASRPTGASAMSSHCYAKVSRIAGGAFSGS